MDTDTANVRLMDVVELLEVERERYEGIKEDFDFVGKLGFNLPDAQDTLQGSLDKMNGYQAWITIKNRPDSEVEECTKQVRKFRKGYSNRKTGYKVGKPFWTNDDIKREYHRRLDAGLTVHTASLGKVDAALQQIIYRNFSGMVEFREFAFGKPEDSLKMGGMQEEEVPTTTRKRKYKKMTDSDIAANEKYKTHTELVEWLTQRKNDGLSNEKDELRKNHKATYNQLQVPKKYADGIREVYGDQVADSLEKIKKLYR